MSQKDWLKLLFFGNAFDAPLYFLMLLIYFTFTNIAIAKLTKDYSYRYFCYIGFSLLCWIFLYLDFVKYFWLPKNVGTGLIEKFFELLPYSFIGIGFHDLTKTRFRFTVKSGLDKWLYSLCSAIVVIILPWLDLYDTGKMEGYRGFGKLIASVILFAIFLYSRDWIAKWFFAEHVTNKVLRIAPLSLGVYCMHYIIGGQIISILSPFTGHLLATFLLVFLLYGLSYLFTLRNSWLSLVVK